MTTRIRYGIVFFMAVVVALITTLVWPQETPQQAMSLAVAIDGGKDLTHTIDQVGLILTRIGTKEELAIGAALAQRIKAEQEDGSGLGAELDTRRYQQAPAYLSAVLTTLIKNGRLKRADIPYNVYLLPKAEINAFAIAGGRIYITYGMLNLIESEAELAAVLGHELAHIDLRHCIERLQYATKAEKLGGYLLADLVDNAYGHINLSYSDKQETEADRQAVLYLERAGYHPQAGQIVFARLLDLEAPAYEAGKGFRQELKGLAKEAATGYLRSHPDLDKRLRAAEALFIEQKIDFFAHSYYVGRENLRQLQPMAENPLATEYVKGRIINLDLPGQTATGRPK